MQNAHNHINLEDVTYYFPNFDRSIIDPKADNSNLDYKQYEYLNKIFKVFVIEYDRIKRLYVYAYHLHYNKISKSHNKILHFYETL